MKFHTEPVTIRVPIQFDPQTLRDAILAHAKEVADSMNRRMRDVLRDAFDVDEGGWPLRGE